MDNDKKAKEFAEKYLKYVKESKELEKSFSKEERDNILKNLNKLNEKFIESEFTVPDHIYVELPLLKDIYLGTLFAMIINRPNCQEDYKYITENIKNYQLRFFDDPLEYFPDLNITREEFYSFLKDENNHDEIYTLAPFTLFGVSLKHNLEQNAQHSYLSKKYTDIQLNDGSGSFIRDYDDVTFYINLHPLKLSHNHRVRLQQIVGDTLGVCVVLIDSDPETISAKFLERMDEINTFRLDILSKNKKVMESFSDFKFVGKYIFAPLMTDPSLKDKLKDEEVFFKDKRFVTNVYKCYSDFKWLEAARYAVDLDVYSDIKDNRSDEEIRETPLPSLDD